MDKINIPKQLKPFYFIKTKEKIPCEPEWNTKNNYRLNDPLFQEYIKNNVTYGVLCGKHNLLIVDLDNPEIQIEVLKNPLFTSTFAVKTAGKGLLHFYFITDKAPESFKCLDKDKNTLLDAQGIGKQAIGPGSTLCNGKQYEVWQDQDIKCVDYNVLKEFLIKYNYSAPVETPENIKKAINDSDMVLAEIKRKIKIKDLLGDFGINTMRNPTQCPFHTSIKGKCFSFTDELYNCFHCDSKGDIFTLYQEYKKCDFISAKYELMKIAGIDSEKIVQKDLEGKAKEQYAEIEVKKFIIYKSKDETIYKIFINDFFVELTPDNLLGCSQFRKKFFNETGRLLKGLKEYQWIELINKWMNEHGEIIDCLIDSNTDFLIKETVISEIESFAVTTVAADSTSYGRCYYNEEDEDYVYVCNKVIEAILRKNQFKINLNKFKVIFDEYIKGKTKVIRTGKKINRFFRFKLDSLDIEVPKIKK